MRSIFSRALEHLASQRALLALAIVGVVSSVASAGPPVTIASVAPLAFDDSVDQNEEIAWLPPDAVIGSNANSLSTGPSSTLAIQGIDLAPPAYGSGGTNSSFEDVGGRAPVGESTESVLARPALATTAALSGEPPEVRAPTAQSQTTSTEATADSAGTTPGTKPSTTNPPTTKTPATKAPTTSKTPATKAPTTEPTTALTTEPTTAPPTTKTPTTAPPATQSTGRDIDLLAMGDIGICGSQDPARVASLLQSQAGEIVVIGDAAYPDGTLSEIVECFAKPFAAVLDRIIPVAGNHEYGKGNADGWKTFFNRTDTYYSRNLGAWRLIVLDTECEYVGGCGRDDPQQVWFAEQLASAPQCTIVAMHRPYRVSSKYDLEQRSKVLHEMAVAANVDVVLSAHEHIYEHLDFGVTQQFVVGTGGAGLRSAGTVLPQSRSIVTEHGAVALKLSTESFSWRFLNTDAATLDSGSANCG